MTATEPSAPTFGRLDPSIDTRFTAGSMVRRVGGEPIVALGVMRILVMDVAHPKVGAGVRDHSSFRSRPFARLWGTADLGLRMVFGDRRVARAAAEQIYRFHDHVNGSVGDDGPEWAAEAGYTAHDASLLLWVWATIVDTMSVTYERWVAPLSDAEADELYADLCRFGRFFGIPADLLPPDRAAFARYLDGVLDSDVLVATPTTVEQVRGVLWYQHPLVLPPVVRLARVMAVGLLDPRLVQRFELDLNDADAQLFKRIDRFLAEWYHRLPPVRRQLPVWYLRLRRPTIGLKRRLTGAGATSPSPS